MMAGARAGAALLLALASGAALPQNCPPGLGRCTRLKTSVGCFVHVDGGRIVGRLCLD